VSMSTMRRLKSNYLVMGFNLGTKKIGLSSRFSCNCDWPYYVKIICVP
jgi:hypothetical protein